ncbi:hypothetical protein ACFP1I_22340 [Dyadobacter subterraneus]|nr:hypothetical protein [Dyadobacter subterraneus]
MTAIFMAGVAFCTAMSSRQKSTAKPAFVRLDCALGKEAGLPLPG